jgi:uroporphyrinogen-III synthase
MSAPDWYVPAGAEDQPAGDGGEPTSAIAFTSAPQVRRFRDDARASGREAELRQGFERITVAAAGSIVAAELEELGVQVNVKPRGDTFFMKPLVRELAVALTKE